MDTWLFVKLGILSTLSATVLSQLEIPDFPDGPDMITCKTYDCPPTATCVQKEDFIYCQCPDKKTGPNCTMDDPCAPRKDCPEGMLCFANCNPNVMCEGAMGVAHCAGCVSGWDGPKCDKDLDECTEFDDICKNGGTCINTFKDYKCACAAGWTGKQCDCIKGDACDPGEHLVESTTHDDLDACTKFHGICKNGGTCTNLHTDYKCTCATGWTGKQCDCKTGSPCDSDKDRVENTTPEKDLDACTKFNGICKNGATCTNLHTDYKCTCATGWMGKQCDCKKDSPCDPGEGRAENIRGSGSGATPLRCWTILAVVLQTATAATLL